jgi:arylsulfatase A-like enzyme
VKPETHEDDVVLDRWFISNKKALSPRAVRLVNDAYDDCIAYLDDQLGRLFDRLEKNGQLDRTLVIITADHGEAFGEHELYGHASSLYDPEIHVPLLMVLPGGLCAGRSVAEPVSLRDLPASIADLVGLAGASPFPGRSLARCWTPDALPFDEPTLAEVDAPVKSAPNQGRSPVFRGAMKALVSGQDVYIHNGDGVEELYHLGSDPAQTRNLADDPDLLPRLQQFREQMHTMTRDDTRPPEWRGIVAEKPAAEGSRRH